MSDRYDPDDYPELHEGSNRINFTLPQFLKTLRSSSQNRSVEWQLGEPLRNLEELLFRCNELAGETGEVCDAVKKYARASRGMVGGDSSIEPIEDELADVLICLDRVADYFDIDLEEAVRTKFNKTSIKYNLKERL